MPLPEVVPTKSIIDEIKVLELKSEDKVIVLRVSMAAATRDERLTEVLERVSE